jgi:dienelactone hydrolase
LPSAEPLVRTARRVLVGLVAVAVGLTAGCSGSTQEQRAAEPPPTTAPPSRPFAVESWQQTFVDPSRPTEAGSQTPASAERTLVTTIYLPEGDEPRPLIVFSHGLVGHPDKFSNLLSTWARAGYVVVAPAFPTTNDRVPGAAANYTAAFGQPDDVSFVLDEVLRMADDETSRLYGRVDTEHIGAGGLSLGGATTYSVTFSACCRDDRFTAAEVLAGALLPLAGEFDLDGHVPLLIVHGDQDPALRYELANQAYVRAQPPVWFVTLLGGSHATPFENDVTPYDAMVEQLTTDFWDATIGGDGSALARFEQHARVDGLSTLQSK